MSRISIVFALSVMLSTSAAAPGQQARQPADSGAAGPKAIKQIRLVNAGFEEGDFLPAGWEQGAEIEGVEYVWRKDAGAGGSARSACIRKTAQRYFPIAAWSQKVAHDGTSRKLLVSVQVKCDDVRKAILDVGFKRGAEWSHQWAAYIGPKDAGGETFTHDWREYRGVVAIPADAQELIIGLQLYGPGTVCFDDVRAAYVADQTPASLYGEDGEPRRE